MTVDRLIIFYIFYRAHSYCRMKQKEFDRRIKSDRFCGANSHYWKKKYNEQNNKIGYISLSQVPSKETEDSLQSTSN
jgi:hypothetical protein